MANEVSRRHLVQARGGIPLRPSAVGLHGEDLVDAHPALLEGERAADEVEAPHPRHLLADHGDHRSWLASNVRYQACTVRA